MTNLIHADIFFFVATVALVVVALAFLAALIYLILILREIRTWFKSWQRGAAAGKAKLKRWVKSFFSR